MSPAAARRISRGRAAAHRALDVDDEIAAAAACQAQQDRAAGLRAANPETLTLTDRLFLTRSDLGTTVAALAKSWSR